MEKRNSNALTPLSYRVLSSDYFFQSFCNIWVSVTPSDNSFTISPHNLAFLHSTLLHSSPVPLRYIHHVQKKNILCILAFKPHFTFQKMYVILSSLLFESCFTSIICNHIMFILGFFLHITPDVYCALNLVVKEQKMQCLLSGKKCLLNIVFVCYFYSSKNAHVKHTLNRTIVTEIELGSFTRMCQLGERESVCGDDEVVTLLSVIHRYPRGSSLCKQ